LNSGIKTKSEEIEWRRAKILELKSQGLDQREISQILHVSPATITFDLQYLRDNARENVRDYTTKQFPLQFKVFLVAIQIAMKQFWNISQNAQDNKEKMQALEHYRQNTIQKLDEKIESMDDYH
jgi:orotate phosphoribosyltransferase-like protein